jgi:gamma-glutamylcyclotransferase (GGCT)/AIG2-like uncharacterized protein YtfP
MVKDTNAVTPGGLWKITPDCESRLDRWEGVSSGSYAKWTFAAKIEGKNEEVLFYKKIGSGGIKPPRDDYFATILKGYKDFGIPEKFWNSLRAARSHAVKNNGKANRVKLFVYGTLKQEYGNHSRIDDAEFVGEAVSADCYEMVAGGYPIIWDDAQGRPVRGELYRVTDKMLADCDALEGHPRFYHRQWRKFVTDDGAHHEAWIYIMRDEHRSPHRGPSMEPNAHGELEWSRQLVFLDREDEQETEEENDDA